MAPHKSGDGPQSPEKTDKSLTGVAAGQDRDQRLAAALRENLRRRKAQASTRGKPGQP